MSEEVKLLVSEAVVLSKDFVDFVDDGLEEA